MQGNSAKIDVPEYRKILENKAGMASKIAEFVQSDGFLILKAFLKNFEVDSRSKRFKTFQEYNARMDALEIIEGLFAELDGAINDGQQAVAQIQQLIEAESSTPSLSLDGEGNDDGQESDLM